MRLFFRYWIHNKWSIRKGQSAVLVCVVTFTLLQLRRPPVSRSISFDIPRIRYSVHPSTTIDIVSIGSINKPALHEAQMRTFGSHETVRTFYPITEHDDADKECHTHLERRSVDKIADHCRRSSLLRVWWNGMRSVKKVYFADKHSLANKANPVGWICAQQRPASALHRVLQDYQDGTPIPDYMFIIDDDTFINVPAVLETLSNQYKSDIPHIVCGCRFLFSEERFNFPYGGYGMILTGAVIAKLIRPIHCSTQWSKFEKQVCKVLNKNNIGEKAVYYDGISLGELMYRYTTQYKYTSVNSWNKLTWIRRVFCLHSDWVWGYFFNYYPLTPDLAQYESTVRLAAYKGYEILLTRTGTDDPDAQEKMKPCHNSADQCSPDTHLCHYMTPEAMDRVQKGILERLYTPQ